MAQQSLYSILKKRSKPNGGAAEAEDVAESVLPPPKRAVLEPLPCFSQLTTRWPSSPEWLDEALDEVNTKVFKNPSFRQNQRQIIKKALTAQDIFVCMQTGGGKSLTFQLPALLLQGVTLVIMPLISLIHDQVTHLNKLGIPNLVFGAQPQNQQEAQFTQLETDSTIKIVFVTPEKLSKSSRMLESLTKLYQEGRLERLVIDEAHCVSQWGRDFRADYLKLCVFRYNYPHLPILALTATATTKVREDVIKVLRMRKALFFTATFNRPNLYYRVVPKSSQVIFDIAHFIRKHHLDECGIIYCISTATCEEVSKRLKRSYGIRSEHYHAKMTPKQRETAHEQWMNNSIHVLVATVAFGMGIDKSDVRFVIHHSFPKSIENYYQESGRAGRDGQPSHCLIYYTASDKARIDYLTDHSNMKDVVGPLLMMEYCEEQYQCRRKILLNHLGEDFDATDCQEQCDNCARGLDSVERDFSPEAIFMTEVLSKGEVKSAPKLLDLLLGVARMKGTSTDFGRLNYVPRAVLQRIIRRLLTTGVLIEKTYKLKKFSVTQLAPSSNMDKLRNRTLKVILTIDRKLDLTIPLLTAAPSPAPLLPTVKLPDASQPLPPAFVSPFGTGAAKDAEELLQRLLLIRQSIAQLRNCDPEDVLGFIFLKIAVETLPEMSPSLPREMIQEIRHFKAQQLILPEKRLPDDIEILRAKQMKFG